MKKLNEDMIIDTLILAKKKFLGQSVSLDSLCKRFNIDLSERNVHGALKDAKLLASVYLELIGGRQSRLDFRTTNKVNLEEEKRLVNLDDFYKKRSLRKICHLSINDEDYKMHLKSIQTINNSIWKKINN